ncbi:MAG: hypothetical protein Q9227_000923 [Pyrenula ochraceoflavens]
MSNTYDDDQIVSHVEGNGVEDGPADEPAEREAIMLCLTFSKRDDTPAQIYALADTGSAANFISRRLVEELGREDDIVLRNDNFDDINEGHISVKEEVTLTVKAGYQQKEYTLEFDILEHADTPLLVGEPFLYDVSAVTVSPEFTNKPTPNVEMIGGLPKPHRHCYLVGKLDKKYFPGPTSTRGHGVRGLLEQDLSIGRSLRGDSRNVLVMGKHGNITTIRHPANELSATNGDPKIRDRANCNKPAKQHGRMDEDILAEGSIYRDRGVGSKEEATNKIVDKDGGNGHSKTTEKDTVADGPRGEKGEHSKDRRDIPIMSIEPLDLEVREPRHHTPEISAQEMALYKRRSETPSPPSRDFAGRAGPRYASNS